MTSGYFISKTSPDFHQPCNCIGPQNGEPACPCAMRHVKIVDGRYVQVNDLGPAPAAQSAAKGGA